MNLQNPRNEEKISVLFSLRYKLEKLFDRKHSITSTKYLRPGQQIRVLDENRIPHDATVQKNTPEGFYVEISAELKNFKPKPLSKFMINFSSATGMKMLREVEEFLKSINDLKEIEQKERKENKKKC